MHDSACEYHHHHHHPFISPLHTLQFIKKIFLCSIKKARSQHDFNSSHFLLSVNVLFVIRPEYNAARACSVQLFSQQGLSHHPNARSPATRIRSYSHADTCLISGLFHYPSSDSVTLWPIGTLTSATLTLTFELFSFTE